MDRSPTLTLDFTRLPARRWGLIFIILSLNQTLEFVHELGLPAFPFSQLQMELRASILEYREHVRVAGDDESLAVRIFSRLHVALGESLTTSFYAWCTGTFMYVIADQRNWYRWYLALSRVVYDTHAASTLVALVGAETSSKICRILDTDRLEASIQDVKKRPLSHWDIEMYARHGLNDETGPDPFQVLLSTVKIVRTQRCVELLVAQFDTKRAALVKEDCELYLARLGFEDARALPDLHEMRTSRSPLASGG